MRNSILVLFWGMQICIASAQKKLITNESWKQWERLRSYDISADGKWVCYKVSRGEQFSTESVLYLSALDGKSRIITDRPSGSICLTPDNRWIICGLSGDSILVEQMQGGNRFFLTGARPGPVAKLKGRMSLFYTSVSSGNKLYSLDLASRQSKVIGQIDGDAQLNPGQDMLVFADPSSLKWMDLNTAKIRELAAGQFKNLTFDQQGTKLVFTEEKDGQTRIFYFQKEKKKALALINIASKGLEGTGGPTGSDLRFSEDRRHVFFKVKPYKTELTDPSRIPSNQELWSYQKRFWKQSPSPGPYETFSAVVTLQDSKTLILEDQTMAVAREGTEIRDDVALLQTRTNLKEAYYRPSEVPEFYLFTFKDGKRKKLDLFRNLNPDLGWWSTVSLSKSGKYLSWSDGKDWYSYQLTTGKVTNLTTSLTKPNLPIQGMRLGKYARWMEDEKCLVFDQYDIYQLDATGKKVPVCLTGYYGRNHQLKIQMANLYNSFNAPYPRLKDGSLVLRAQNDINKTDGFASVQLDRPNSFKLLSQDARLYSHWGALAALPSEGLLKAKNAEVFLVKGQSTNEAPNVYFSTDLSDFRRVSAIRPQEKYNWMSSELVNYPMRGGEQGKAILYKPENFDPSKKYPVIFFYYQEITNALHEFLNPDLSRGMLNIPWFVSNGYLVCVPDILNSEPGQISERTINSVVSAAEFLKKNSWFDYSKMGLQGHSMGGYETNLLIAGTHIFAAAQASSGRADQIMGYDMGAFGHTFVERGQPNLGGSIWSDLPAYIRNSPIFQADQMTTPLLLMHNKDDHNVVFAHSYELFAGLRRLSKPVWLLSYANEGHTIEQVENRLDFQIRQQQFFDHYLKGNPAPDWMLRDTTQQPYD